MCSVLASNEASNAAPVYYVYSRASLVSGKGARYELMISS